MASVEPFSPAELRNVVSIDLGEDATILVDTTLVDDGGIEEVAWTDGFEPDQFFKSIRLFAESLASALKAAAPTKINAEFGLKAAIESGKLTAFLVDGKGEATISVGLEWERQSAK